MEEKTRYCKQCGAKLEVKADNQMNWVKRPGNYEKFDSFTGKPIDYSGLSFKCPNSTFWGDHDYYFLLNGL